MTDQETRLELLRALTELSQEFPDWRLGQMIANLATAAGLMNASGVWDLEDDQALTAARRLLERRKGQIPVST